MRLLAVSGSADDDDVADAVLATPWLDEADRALLFGGVASAVARVVAARVRAQEDAYFDAAARHLAGDDDEPPPRPPQDPRFARLVAVTREDPSAFAPVAAAVRAVELLGPLVVMAVSTRRALDDEEIENADIWIAGDAPTEPSTRGGRHVVGPGDFCSTGRALLLRMGRRGAELTWLDTDGAHHQRTALPLRDRTRMRTR